MSFRDPERLKSYLDLISGGPAGLESLAGATLASDSDLEIASASVRGSTTSAATAVLEFASAPNDATPDAYAEVEAIISATLRPAVDVVRGTFSMVHGLWKHLSDDLLIRASIERVLPAIGRIELPGSDMPYGGTGFVVGPGIMMTNRHVAEIFASGVGDRHIKFRSDARAAINFTHERGEPLAPDLEVTKVVMIHPYWDMAILQVAGMPTDMPFLQLSSQNACEMAGTEICISGYPAFDPRNPADIQNALFEHRFGIKRLQPGKLQAPVRTGSFGKMVDAAGHDCSTLGGNSGSAVFDPRTGRVLALHFGGSYQRVNYAVPSAALVADARVTDAGVAFDGREPAVDPPWISWWIQADQESNTTTLADDAGSPSQPAIDTASNDDVASQTYTLEIPIRLTVSLGEIRRLGGSTRLASSGAATETLREPWRDSAYASRRGYDENFLGSSKVQMPTPSNVKVLAPTFEGAHILHYQNFSIAMHAKRRLALFTASNVTKETKLRKPDATANYSRRGLSGLGENDQERWFVDPRMDARYQLPDIFFTKDRGAFDKGHIVRRDDIAWGRTYDELRRANGDSYHVTNCSPQVAAFNRSNLGSLNWGELENRVLAAAATQRLCVFAGPVVAESDSRFVGAGAGGQSITAQIPTRYWKLIVCQGTEGLEAFAFVLEQDLAGVDLEFTVPPGFVPFLYPVNVLQVDTGIVFSDDIIAADQYGSSRADELVSSGALVRKRR